MLSLVSPAGVGPKRLDTAYAEEYGDARSTISGSEVCRDPFAGVHRLVWLNPLAADADYEPLTKGIRAAIPHVGPPPARSSSPSLEELADILEDL